MTRWLLGLAVVATATTARAADEVVLRMASEAPQGTAWARESQAWARDMRELTKGTVDIKWYLGGIAGDELQMLDRMRRDQLDGVASGGMLCQKLAPSMRALRVPGLFQSRDESQFVSSRLKDVFDREFQQAGFVNLGELGIGPDIIFSRKPIANLAALRQTRMWVWDLDDTLNRALGQMGMKVVPTRLEAAYRQYEDGKLDALFAVPTAALAYQWSAETHYYIDLHASFLRGCLLISSRAYDQLPVAGQQAIRQSAARAIARLEEVGRAQDDALVNGLFRKQGLQQTDVSESFRAEFLSAARAMRDLLGDKLVPQSLLQRVLALLADYRAEHGSSAR